MSDFSISSHTANLSPEEIQRRYGLTEEQAKLALQNRDFVVYVQSSAVSSMEATKLLEELKTATQKLVEIVGPGK